MSSARALTAAAEGGQSPTPILEARGLVKHYGHITALDGADFDLREGEVLGLVGDNGAGKSTLIKALSGAIIPDAGEILLEGHRVNFQSPRDARAAGIETVYQDLAVAPALDIASNIYLGREVRRKDLFGVVFRKLDYGYMRETATRHLMDLGIGLKSVRQSMETLSGGQRQAVAVARAAAWGRRIIIMDEPTAALGVRQAGQVLELVQRIRARGLAVVLISHNMPQVFEVADRIYILRLGRRAAVLRPQDTTMADVVSIMVGAIGGDVPARGQGAATTPTATPPGYSLTPFDPHGS
jgi:fructose transport system ATP-binding protein